MAKAIVNPLFTEGTLSERRLAFLEDTVKHFNINNRGYKPDACLYAEGCAIGRHLTERNAKTLDKWPDLIDNILKDYRAKYIPKWMRELGADFLRQVQRLHDTSGNWDDDGLTDWGKKEYAQIKRDFLLSIRHASIN